MQKLRRLCFVLSAVCLILSIFLCIGACAAKTTNLKNGTYTAEQDDYDESGWKEYVTITVSGGKITAVDWNALQEGGGPTKKELSESGEYDMTVAGAISQWHEQASSMEAALINEQDPSKIQMNSESRPDAVSGVTIKVNTFLKLSQKALDMAK